MKNWESFDSQKHAIMTCQQVRDYDAWAIKTLGIPGTTLMENAGRSAAEVAVEMLAGIPEPTAAVFCGTGNNGGDGFVIARHLVNFGVQTQVILCAPCTKLQGDAQINFSICKKMGLPVVDLLLAEDKIHDHVQALCEEQMLIVDAIFGTGFKGELSSSYAMLVSCLNALKIPILAVDIPSGMDCDSGDPLPVCIEAVATISFVGAKQGFFTDGQLVEPLGKLYIASIGIATNSRIKS